MLGRKRTGNEVRRQRWGSNCNSGKQWTRRNESHREKERVHSTRRRIHRKVLMEGGRKVWACTHVSMHEKPDVDVMCLLISHYHIFWVSGDSHYTWKSPTHLISLAGKPQGPFCSWFPSVPPHSAFHVFPEGIGLRSSCLCGMYFPYRATCLTSRFTLKNIYP